MFFKQLKVEGLGCYSYLIGCPRAGNACVVDPERHVGRYLDAAQENGCDLIVMGGYGFSPVVEIVLGSAVDQVLRESQHPVLICR